MRVLFIPRKGVDLYETLLSSETSRDALRFYAPVRTPAGMEISMATMGGALSFASDLRWYVRRYMHEVLFELPEGMYCTRALAREIYFGRAAILHKSWKFRRSYTLKDGSLISDEPIPGKGRASSYQHDPSEVRGVVLEVWCTKEEYEGCTVSEEEEGGEDQE